MDGKQRQVPLNTNSSIIEVETSWTSSENSMSAFNSSLIKSSEQDTGDSRASKSTRVMCGIQFLCNMLVFSPSKAVCFLLLNTVPNKPLT